MADSRDYTIKDFKGKAILEGDVLLDNVPLPLKGIVFTVDGEYFISSDYQGRDIKDFSNCDLLTEDLIRYNRMIVIGNIHDNPSKV